MTTEKRNKQAALEYARWGWPVFPLYYVTDQGVCSCSKGKRCTNSLAQLEREYGNLPVTAEVLTGGGGRREHYQGCITEARKSAVVAIGAGRGQEASRNRGIVVYGFDSSQYPGR